MFIGKIGRALRKNSPSVDKNARKFFLSNGAIDMSRGGATSAHDYMFATDRNNDSTAIAVDRRTTPIDCCFDCKSKDAARDRHIRTNSNSFALDVADCGVTNGDQGSLS